LSRHHYDENKSSRENCKCTAIHRNLLSCWSGHKDTIKSPQKCQATIKEHGVAQGWKPEPWTAAVQPPGALGQFQPDFCYEHNKSQCTSKWVYKCFHGIVTLIRFALYDLLFGCSCCPARSHNQSNCYFFAGTILSARDECVRAQISLIEVCIDECTGLHQSELVCRNHWHWIGPDTEQTAVNRVAVWYL